MRIDYFKKKETKYFWCGIILVSIIGFALRWTGIRYEGVDYRECLSEWYRQLKEVGTLKALVEFEGDYNLPYATALLILTYLPVEPIIGIKLLSVIFDYLSGGVLAAVVMDCCEFHRYKRGLITYALVLFSPITVINSGYLAQSDGIYAALAILTFHCLLRDKPVKGMAAFGCAVAMKLQAVFAVPIMGIIYWCRKRFSALHLLWIPVTIQALCMPAVIAGCGIDIAIRVYTHLMGEYPFMYYYYPNIWTYFQNAPYYVFGRVAIAFTFGLLLLYCVLVALSKREHRTEDYLEYFVWTAMTCVMFLPCMHERYNYLAEVLILALAVIRPNMRIPALILCLVSFQCYGQGFLGYEYVSPYFLAACNLGVYIYLSGSSLRRLMADARRDITCLPRTEG